MKQTVRVAVWFTICNLLQRIAALICTPIYTRILTTVQYGQYATWNSWVNIITVFATLNLFGSSYVAGMTKYEEDEKQYTAAVVGLSITISAVLMLVYSLVKKKINLSGLPAELIYALLLKILFNAGFSFWAVSERYHHQYKKLLAVTLAFSLSNVILVPCFMIAAPAVWRLHVRIFTEVSIWACVGVFCLKKIYAPHIHFFNGFYWKNALKTNIPLIPHYLSSSILSHFDRTMIRDMVGGEKTAFYSLAYSVSMGMTVLTYALKSVFDPYIYHAVKEKKSAGISKDINLLLLFVMTVCTLVIAIAPEIIAVMAPKEYQEACYVFPPIIASVYFLFSYNIFSSVEFFYGKTKWITLVSCIGAACNVALNDWLIPIYGYIAAGYTTLFCYMLFAAGHLGLAVILAKKNTVGRFVNVKKVLFMSVIMICIAGAFAFLYPYDLIRYFVVCFIFTVIFVKRKGLQECFAREGNSNE